MAVARSSRVAREYEPAGSSALAAIADLLSPPRNPSQIYDTILAKALEVLKLEHGNLRLLNPGSGELELMAEKGFSAEYGERFRSIKMGERTAGKIVRTRAPVLWDNIQTDPSCSYLFLKRQGINSLLGVPVLARDGIMGTLSVASPKRGRFEENDIQLLAAIGKVVGVAIENHRLIMALRNNIDELTRLTLKLEESDGVKDRLLSVMSHEMRTPISIILGNTELLTAGTFGEVTPRQKESLLTVRRSGAGLLFHVENALEVSQLEGGGVPMHPRRCKIDEIRDAMMDLLGEEAERKGLEMRWEIDPGLPTLFTDLGKLTRVFRNLIHNAVKFTEKGSVAVRVSYWAGEQRALCEVVDTGIGIPRNQFGVIFDPFHQLDSSHTRMYGGMGLGLRYVKKTLESLGGGIEVESTPGEGSVFRFWFPAHFGGTGVDGR